MCPGSYLKPPRWTSSLAWKCLKDLKGTVLVHSFPDPGLNQGVNLGEISKIIEDYLLRFISAKSNTSPLTEFPWSALEGEIVSREAPHRGLLTIQVFRVAAPLHSEYPGNLCAETRILATNIIQTYPGCRPGRWERPRPAGSRIPHPSRPQAIDYQ